ncbi:MAG: TonB-dependent receptor [Pseudomonadales bacterium]|nr:TonB-dependent receptor [Pseudomonadales bacterium]
MAEEPVIEEIVVTGSYIKRAPEDAPSPVRTFGREELEAKGNAQLADMVMKLPAVIGSENVTAQEQSVGGAGAANINIRNLGLASTLVLIDGKRVNVGTSISNQGEQFVDINRLPFIMIENVEILKDGASAIYGSDAVAGVANFKLRNNFEGFEIRAMYQDSFKNRDADFKDLGLPEIYRDSFRAFSEDESNDTDIGAIWGFSNDDTHIVIGGNYFERDALHTLDRDYAVRDVVDGSVGGPSPFNLPQDMFASLIVPGLGEIPGANLIEDSSCIALGSYRTRNSGLCSTKNDLLSRDIFSEETRRQLLGTFTHAINDKVEAYGHFGGSENEVVINQSPSFPITSQSSFTADNPGLIYEVNNATLSALTTGGTPYGDDVANRLSSQIVGAPYPFPVLSFVPGVVNPADPAAVLDSIGAVTFNGVALPSVVHLMHARGVAADVNGDGVVDEGERFKGRNQSSIDRDTRMFTVGLRGDLNDTWNFDASYSFSKEETTTTFYDTVSVRLQDALNGFFGIGCDKNAPGQMPGEGLCTWFNPFGNSILEPDVVVADGNGNLHTLGNDAAYTNTLFGEGVVEAESRLTVLDAVLSSTSLFGWELNGGGVGFAIGAQYRKEEQRVGGNELATDSSFPFAYTGPTIPYSASQEIYAIFAEVALPLTDNLELQGALRYEDYGGDTGDTVDPKLAARWQVSDTVVLRGSVGTSFRGPSLNQKFGRGTGLQFVSPPLTEVVDANFPGDPTATFGSGVFARIPTFGNEALQPEESTNFNIGIIVSPIDALSISLDYFNYQYEDIIISEDFRGLANDCQIGWQAAGRPVSLLPDGSINPDYLDVVQCNFRNLDGDASTPDILLDTQANPLSIQSTYQNGTELDTSGLDLLVRYNFETDYGAYGATLDLSYFLEYEIDRAITPFDTRLNPGETVDLVGRSENVLVGRPLPEWKASLLLDWSMQQHYAAVVINYVDSIIEPGALPQPVGDPLDLKVDAFTSVDASYTYAFETYDLSLTVGAANLFDEEPPTASGFNSFESTVHDPRGRLWYFRMRYQL